MSTPPDGFARCTVEPPNEVERLRADVAALQAELVQQQYWTDHGIERIARLRTEMEAAKAEAQRLTNTIERLMLASPRIALAAGDEP